MVNVGFSWSSMLGIVLAVAGAALYFLRSVRPGLARDHDIFFAAVALLCGGILFFQGWRQDPILQFGQFLLTGSAIFFAFESIRLRGVATEQAERNTPFVEEDRPVSRVYRAEFDELNPVEDRPPTRRIRGSKDVRTNRPDEYEDDVRRRPSNRRNNDEQIGPGDRPRRRRSRPDEDRPVNRPNDVWDDGSGGSADWDSSDRGPRKPARPSGGSGPTRPSRPSPDAATKPRRSRSPQSRRPERNEPSTDYVDFQPIDTPDDDEADNSSNFDF